MPQPLENPQNTYTIDNPNDAAQLLTNTYRTRTIELLATHHTLTIDELADLIHNTTQPETKTKRDIADELRHIHIPMLTTADVVEKHDDTIIASTPLDALNSAYTAFCSKLQ